MVRLSVLLLLLGSLANAQDTRGLIRGIVLDQYASPVANAFVMAEAIHKNGPATVLNTYTDRTGQFVLQSLTLGEYHLSAQKEDEGYLSTRPNAFSHAAPLTATLTGDAPLATVVIRFGPKCGFVVGRVRDQRTGVSLPAQFSIKPVGGSQTIVTATDGKQDFRLKVQPHAAFTFQVNSPGYKTWTYSVRLGRTNRQR